MKRYVCIGFSVLLCFLQVSCDINETRDILRYQKTGASVAGKKYSEDYDCSNFSVQFYQDCFNIGLPCRIRMGVSGGSGFKKEGHAWNSVLIDGKWVDWEPQNNNIHNGHVQTSTSVGTSWGSYTQEELSRIICELIGRNVPGAIIDNHEIDKHTYENSPFNSYFGGLCIGEDITLHGFLLTNIQTELPNNGDGRFYITYSNMMVHWFYKMDGKHYVIVNLRAFDNVAGRTIIQNNTNVNFSGDGAFFKLDPSMWPK